MIPPNTITPMGAGLLCMTRCSPAISAMNRAAPRSSAPPGPRVRQARWRAATAGLSPRRPRALAGANAIGEDRRRPAWNRAQLEALVPVHRDVGARLAVDRRVLGGAVVDDPHVVDPGEVVGPAEGEQGVELRPAAGRGVEQALLDRRRRR